jgi:putative ABC transport system permease protein
LRSYLEKEWKITFPGKPFESKFQADIVYEGALNNNLKQIFFFITLLGCVLSASGIYALASLNVQKRTKEIGIRKVLGADVKGLVGLLSKDFAVLVVIASFIAFPIAWWALNKWLQDFAYRISIQWWVFVVGAAAALLIALATVSIQAIKAAMANPVKSLRTE